MKPSQVAKCVAIAIQTRRPLFIRGRPGAAKSSIVKAVCRATSHTYADIRVAGMDIGDLAMPIITNDRELIWSISNDLPRDPNTVLLLDDASQGTPAVMNMLSEIILDRTLKGANNYTLPPDAVIIATGNRKEDRSATHTTPQHINNRFWHVTMEVDVDEWIEHMRDPSQLPDVSLPSVTQLTAIHPHLTAFHRFRPNLLEAFDATAEAFPSPRSIDMLNTLLPYALHPQLDDLQFELVQACTGEGYATEFVSFVRLITQMPDPDLPLLQPTTAPIPTSPGINYALMGAIAERVTPKTANNMFIYLHRHTQQEFAVLCVQDAMRKHGVAIVQCAEGVKWCAANAKFLMK